MLNAVSTLHASSRTWDLDTLGNWDSTATWDGTSFGNVESRTHNDANELESRTPPGAGSPLAMTFDKAGNMLTQEIGDGTTTVTYTYDAWNRLVKIAYNASIRSEYSYNGLNWRVLKRADTSHDGDLDQQRVMYYNESNCGGWQLFERFKYIWSE
jgi:YD repeat-containing protein